MRTATLVTKTGERFERPLLESFSLTVDGKAFSFVVTASETAIPGTVFPDKDLFVVSDEASGLKVTTFRHVQLGTQDGVLKPAREAVEALIAKYGPVRTRLVLDSAPKLEG